MIHNPPGELLSRRCKQKAQELFDKIQKEIQDAASHQVSPWLIKAWVDNLLIGLSREVANDCAVIISRTGTLSDVPVMADAANLICFKYGLKFPSEPLPTDYGDLFTLDEFAELCKGGVVANDDGIGYYATDKEMSTYAIKPSEFETGKVDKSYTHVIWFNK